MEYAIETDVPLPNDLGIGHGGQEGRPTKYPWGNMRVGSSFWVRCPEGKKPSDVGNSLTSAARNWARNNATGAKFASRQEANGARVWRIE